MRPRPPSTSAQSTEPKISALSLSASLHPPSRPSSAPPLAGSPLPFRSSSPASTPYGALRASASRSRAAHSSSPAPPTFDRARADELVALAEEDLTLLGLDKLRAVSDELERISVEASGALTHALMMREKEGQDKEVYNGMIQVRCARSLARCGFGFLEVTVQAVLPSLATESSTSSSRPFCVLSLTPLSVAPARAGPRRRVRQDQDVFACVGQGAAAAGQRQVEAQRVGQVSEAGMLFALHQGWTAASEL